jgi:carboxyl-terminal processing protease
LLGERPHATIKRMTRRNLLLIFFAAVISLVCYHRAARNPYVGTLAQVMNIIDAQYVDPVDDRVLFEGAMDGMFAQLDANSGYVNPRKYRELREDLDQEFGGVGIMVELHPDTQRLTVMTPLVGTPAHKAGLRSGDQIMAIDGKDTAGMTLDDAVRLMRGPEGSPVMLSILHEDAEKPVDVTLERARIPIESVLGDLRRKDGSWIYHLEAYPEIGYIRLTNFGRETAEELRQALQGYREPGNHIEGLILDLRGNAGGLLSAAVETCDMFLDEGTIVTTRGRGGVERERYSATPGVEIGHDVPMVVLVDKYSASASEIVAACLQDHGRAVVAGQRSWGKGTVQNVIDLEGNRSALRLTIASYWRPSGKDIHKRKDAKPTDPWGVQPNKGLEVNLTNELFAAWYKARRERDLMTVDEEGHAVSILPHKNGDKEENTPPSATLEDPQLKKAVEGLEQKLGGSATRPGTA